MQWYYVVKGERFGPVNEEELLAQVHSGTLKPIDLVWNETMGQQWVKAATMPLLFHSQAVAVFPGSPGFITSNRDLMEQARECLTGNWGLSMVVFLVAGLIVGGLGAIPCAGALITLFLGGAFQLGTTIYFLALSRKQTVEFGMLFEGFKCYGTTVLAYLLIAIFVTLWTLLLIVPGIIAGLRYSQTYFVIADNPEIRALDAIRQSKALMQHNKWKLFCLEWRFFGWILLCVLTLGIGFLWLVPYMKTSLARFYDDVKASQMP